MNKAEQFLAQVKEEGIKQSLAEEVENLKSAANKTDAALDEVNTQAKDLLTRIASTLQKEKENEEQDPLTLVLYQKLYDSLISLHTYLENNHGSDADFDKVDALLDQLAAKSKDKEALLELAKTILALNQEIKSKAVSGTEAEPKATTEATSEGTKPASSTETGEAPKTEGESVATSEENKPSDTLAPKPSEANSEKAAEESTNAVSDQVKPAE